MSERSVTIRFPQDSLADVDPDYFGDMVEARIADHFGGDYFYDIRPASVHATEITLEGDWTAGAEETIRCLQRDAWEACCREEPVPQD